MSLAGKKIVLGVSGGIAAYKIPELVRRLRDRGADVRVAMTEAAKAFITPLSLQAVSGYPVSDSLLDPAAEAAMGHIEPGIDDLSGYTCACSRAPRHEPADVPCRCHAA